MEKKKIKISVITLIIVVIAIILLIAVVIKGMHIANQNKALETSQLAMENKEKEISEEKVSKNNDTTDTNTNTNTPTNEKAKDYFVLYEGEIIDKKTGIQLVEYTIPINNENTQKYEITYYNYENGKYLGESQGKLEKNYDDYEIVHGVRKIATSQYYNALPRSYTRTNTLPDKLIDMSDCSSVDIDAIDLDNDGKKENIVCWTESYSRGDIGDENSEPVASSGIMLFDSNYNKIADLVNLDNGFWGNIKEEEYKLFLSLDKVEYFDMDNDGIMEILIDLPTYEGTEISIIKYNKGTIDGTINYQASVQP